MTSEPVTRVLLAGLFVIGGCCEHYVVNPRLECFDAKGGYRFRPSDDVDANQTLLILTFSGGGTRAAAFAYGALAALHESYELNGSSRTLLDEVDLISSVSGGSFTAAWYGLYGDRIFNGDFQSRVLEHNIDGDLFCLVANPLNWIRLASPTFDRIDLAAEYYDRSLFDGKTFKDLPHGTHRPFIVLNATDMAVGARFEFTQDQFDLLYSDLDRFSIGRAVAASSAFPILLSPVRLVNHSSGADFVIPQWIQNGLLDEDVNPVRHSRAKIAASYLERDKHGDGKQRHYLHLLDGGIADNLGLRGPMVGLTSNDGSSSFLNLINNGMVKQIIVIVIDAKTEPDHDWDRAEASPSMSEVLMTVCNAPMDNYSTDAVRLVQEGFEMRLQQQSERSTVEKIVRTKTNDPSFALPPLQTVDFKLININFDRITDVEKRKRFKNLPTNFHLSHDDVAALIDTAKELLKAPLAKLLDELQAHPSGSEHRTQ